MMDCLICGKIIGDPMDVGCLLVCSDSDCLRRARAAIKSVSDAKIAELEAIHACMQENPSGTLVVKPCWVTLDTDGEFRDFSHYDVSDAPMVPNGWRVVEAELRYKIP